MDREQTRRSGEVLKALGEEWRELVAGREGFLTEPKRAGLLRRRVVWGEMDSMVREDLYLLSEVERSRGCWGCIRDGMAN
jgi:hypothetical protein